MSVVEVKHIPEAEHRGHVQMFLLIIQYVFRNRAVPAQLVIARPDDIADIALAHELCAQAGRVMRDLVRMSVDRGKDSALVRLPPLTTIRHDAASSDLSQHAC